MRHARKDNASLLLEDGGEAGGGGFVFWEVVEVQVVLCSLGCIHYHGIFCFMFGFRVFVVFVFMER